MPRPFSKWWILFLPLIFSVVPAWVAWNFAYVVPVSDHWSMVAMPLFDWLDGRPFLSAMHQQSNDSRYDVSTIIEMLIVRGTNWNLRIESLVCVLIACGTSALTVWIFRKFSPAGRLLSWVLAFLAVALILSPHQSMNWTFGVQICYACVVLLTLSVVALFHTELPLWLRSLLAGLCAAAAAHSFLNGWLAWVLGSFCLLREARKDGRWLRTVLPSIVIWLVLLAATAAIFFPGYRLTLTDSGGGSSPMTRVTTDPLALVRFFLSLLGAPLGEGWATFNRDVRITVTSWLAPVMGILSLLLFAAVLTALVRGRTRLSSRSSIPFLLLAFWGLMNAVMVSIGRVGHELSDPFQSRYLAFVNWFHIGLIALLAFPAGRLWRSLLGLWFAVVVYGYAIGFTQGTRAAIREYHRGEIVAAACALRHVAPEPFYLDVVWPGFGPGIVALIDRVDAVGCLHIATVKSALVADAPSGNFSRGTLEEGALAAAGIFLRGWAVELPAWDMADAVAISFQREGAPEEWLGLAQRRVVRPKPADKLKSPAMEGRIGWEYRTPEALETSPGSGKPDMIRARKIPSGRVTFRAYAYQITSGAFSPLNGSFQAEMP